MIVSKRTYDAVSKGEPHITRWQAQKVRHVFDEKMTVHDHTGEVREHVTFGAFRRVTPTGEQIGCPAPVGTVKLLQFRDEEKKPRGKILVVSTKTYPYVGDDGRPMWAIEWQRVGPHNPIPAENKGAYLASGHGYTSSPKRSIDRDAPVYVTDDVRRVMKEERRAQAETRKRRLEQMAAQADELKARIAAELSELDEHNFPAK